MNCRRSGRGDAGLERSATRSEPRASRGGSPGPRQRSQSAAPPGRGGFGEEAIREAPPAACAAPRGNHEDFTWLEEQREAGVLEVLPGLRYLPNGEVTAIEADGEGLSVGGIGGCFGSSDYERPASSLQSWAQRHFTRDEVWRLTGHGHLDVLLLHDAPAGVAFTWRRKDGSVRCRYEREAEGLRQALLATKPILCLFGHYHTRLDAVVEGVPCLGLNKVPYPGSLVALDIDVERRSYEVVGEW
jgi:hypothetical protein